MIFRRDLERMAEIYEGIAVFSVEPGTASHRAGVRSGDIVVAVNGRRVRRVADYAWARSSKAELLELVVVRRGRRKTLWAADADHGPLQAAHREPRQEPGPELTSTFRGVA